MLPTAIVDAKMNLFEARHNKKRRQLILGEKLQKGSTRRNLNKVAVSNAKRSLSLLLDLNKEGHNSTFVDHQIKLKNGAPLSETQSAALRMRILRTRNARKASRSAFNLSDDTNGLAIKSSHLADANAESSDDGSLDITHKGCRIKDLKDDTLLNDDNGCFSDDDVDQLDTELPSDAHFGGGFQTETADGTSQLNRTRKEIYEEVIAKSKKAKADRLREQATQNNQREKLDEDFRDLHTLLNCKPSKWSQEGLAAATEQKREEAMLQENDYDRLVKAFAFEDRCRPTNRVKTDKELAADRIAQFERLEQERLHQLEHEEEEENEGSSEDTETTDGVSDTESSESSFTDDEGNSLIEEKQQNNTLTPSDASSEDESDSLCVASATQTGSTPDSKSTARKAIAVTDSSASQSSTNVNRLYKKSSNRSQVLIAPDVIHHYKTTLDERADFSISSTAADADSGVPFYAVNDPTPWERDLPFRVSVPESFEELAELLSSRTPIAQRKLVYRMRALTDPCLAQENGVKLKRLLVNLITYLHHSLTEQFSTGKVMFLRYCDSISEVPGSVHLDAIAVLTALATPTMELAESYPDQLTAYFAPRLILLTTRISEETKSGIEKLRDFEQWKPLLEECSGNVVVDDSRLLTPYALALLYLINIFYPKTSSRHPLVTPALMVIDTYAQRISGMGKCSFDPYKKETHSTSSPTSERDSAVLPALSELCSVANAVVLFSLMADQILAAPRYFPGFFPLGCAILNKTARLADTPSQRVTADVCETLSRILELLLHSATGNSSFDLLLGHVILPTTTALLTETSNPSLKKLHRYSVTTLKRAVPPIHMGTTAPEGIQMLVPKYIDATQASGARHLRHRGATEEAVMRKKLKRELQSARRTASRQLRRDAEFLSAVRAAEKRKLDVAREAKYKKTIATLEKDAEELHRMRTSVVAGGKPKRRVTKRK